MSSLTRKAGNMASKLSISTQLGVYFLLVVFLFNNQVIASGETSVTSVPSSLMNELLFKNYSDSFSAKEMEDAMISLNRTKRQSLNLLQLAQLAGLNQATPAPQVNSSNGGQKQSSDSLLASCQLTNLLLYQLLQQKQQAANPLGPLLGLANANLQGLGSNLNLNVANSATAGSLINPFPAINQNLIFPAQTLETYTTTTTFVTKLTTTAVLTIPLLFGNKPVPTTITRTKTYEVTTSEVQTLTSTVKPTYITQVIAPTPTAQTPSVTSSPSFNDVEEEAQSPVSASVSPKRYQSSKQASPEYEDEEQVPVSPGRIGSGTLHSKLSKSRTGTASTNTNSNSKRRKPGRSSSSTKSSPFTSSNSRFSNRDRDYDQSSSRYSTTKDRDDYYETDYQPYSSQNSGKKATSNSNTGFSKRKYGNIYEDDVAVDEDPAAAQYPDDYSYYTRRLKRGEQYGDEQEYQLEPSTDGDFSNNYQKYERCPPIPKPADPQTVTVTRTETKTVTKFLGQPSLASLNLNSASRASYADTSKSSAASGSSGSSRKRSRSRNRSTGSSSDTSASYSAPAPTTETRPSSSTSQDTRAQILLRSRSRYSSSNSNSNTNNNNYQQPNYDYYRG